MAPLMLAAALWMLPDAGAAQPQGDEARAARLAGTAFDSLRLLLDRALVTSRVADFDQALAVIAAELAERPGDAMLQHYRGFALYRKASVLAATRPGDPQAKAMLEAADRALIDAEPLGWPETLVLRSAVVGQLIGFSGPFGAMRMGPRAQRLLDEAAAQAPDNPRVWMLRGVSYLYRPRLFGGGADKAERDLRRAVALFASDTPAAPAPWWGRAEAHGWLGETLAKQGRVAEARAEFARALELQPGNAWVRDFLLPGLEKGER